MVGLLHHRPDNPLDFIDVCLDRVREIGWKNVRWNTFSEDSEGHVCQWSFRKTGTTGTPASQAQIGVENVYAKSCNIA